MTKFSSTVYWTLPLLMPLLMSPHSASAVMPVHHDLEVRLEPATHMLEVQDTLSLPADLAQGTEGGMTFVLHAGLSPMLVQGDKLQALTPVVEPASESTAVPLERFVLPAGLAGAEFVLRYRGELFHPLDSEAAMQARGFQETAGIISEEGVFLSGSSYWIPTFSDALVTFSLAVDLPSGWQGLSQGNRVGSKQDEMRHRSLWSSPEPQDQVYLVAALFTEYHRTAGKVDAFALLRTPDPELADRYLVATEQYLQLYERLLGPYPYGKFALVENFWETGYGMPSFTLLGQKVIRLPFILTSSYPHEILHNWWGNGVYVDYTSGNWCEGLTAYLSDFLFQEATGKGLEYRQETLQKYTDYAAQERDFALSEFRERRSSATEAVGYGKSLMVWHMLRLQIGDTLFLEGLRQFYRDHQFKVASFKDLQASFEAVSKASLEPFFAQWIERPGAPVLSLSKVKFSGKEGAWRMTALLEQTQEGPAYALRVPLALTLEGQNEATVLVQDVGRKTKVSWEGSARPLRLDVDPSFDVFRVLDRAEIPPALSGLFGAKKVAVLIPQGADETQRASYRSFLEALVPAHSGQVTFLSDTPTPDLSGYGAVWVVGWEAAQRGWITNALTPLGINLDAPTVSFPDTPVPREGHTMVMAVDDPVVAGRTLGFLATDRAEALPALTMRLPHYHKYSFLAFTSADGKNFAKGRWPVVGSPLTYVTPTSGGQLERGTLPARVSLAGPGPLSTPSSGPARGGAPR